MRTWSTTVRANNGFIEGHLMNQKVKLKYFELGCVEEDCLKKRIRLSKANGIRNSLICWSHRYR